MGLGLVIHKIQRQDNEVSVGYGSKRRGHGMKHRVDTLLRCLATNNIFLTETTSRAGFCRHTQCSPMFRAHGTPGQLYAFKIDAPIPSSLITHRCSKRKIGAARLGRTRWSDGNCTLMFSPWPGAFAKDMQVLFLIDLPRKQNSPEQKTTAFFDDLVYFLKASTLNEKIIAKLSEFDFSETANIAFVHTM